MVCQDAGFLNAFPTGYLTGVVREGHSELLRACLLPGYSQLGSGDTCLYSTAFGGAVGGS